VVALLRPGGCLVVVVVVLEGRGLARTSWAVTGGGWLAEVLGIFINATDPLPLLFLAGGGAPRAITCDAGGRLRY
jgi:hypothetical protein